MSDEYEDYVEEAPDEEPTEAAEPLEVQARRLVDKKRALAAANAVQEKASKEYLAEEKSFWDRMHDQLSKAKTINPDLGEGYGVIQLQRRESVTGRVIDPAAAIDSFSDEERQTLLNSTAFRQKVLNEMVRTRRKAGQPLPPGIDFHSRKFVTVSEKKG